jgi:tRNA(fMet)-specific endonuclease VapC
MSVFILDTDIMTLYQQGQPRVVEHVLAHPLPELAIAVVGVEEELTGCYTKLRKARKRDQLARAYQEAVPFFARFQILSFTEAAIVRYEGLRAAAVVRHHLRNTAGEQRCTG